MFEVEPKFLPHAAEMPLESAPPHREAYLDGVVDAPQSILFNRRGRADGARERDQRECDGECQRDKKGKTELFAKLLAPVALIGAVGEPPSSDEISRKKGG